MFTLNIASGQISREILAAASVELQSDIFSNSPLLYPFPAAGSIFSFDIELFRPVPFDTRCTVPVGPGKLEFRYENLGDILNLVLHQASAFTATVFHRRQHSPAVQCAAVCSDGTEAPGCVLCQSGDLIGKICC